jgi:hypothetical protein
VKGGVDFELLLPQKKERAKREQKMNKLKIKA